MRRGDGGRAESRKNDNDPQIHSVCAPSYATTMHPSLVDRLWTGHTVVAWERTGLGGGGGRACCVCMYVGLWRGGGVC